MHSAVRPEKAGRKELQGQKRLGEAAKKAGERAKRKGRKKQKVKIKPEKTKQNTRKEARKMARWLFQKSRRRVGSMFLCALLSVSAGGCGMRGSGESGLAEASGKPSSKSSAAGLTDRQKSILRRRHLPVTYEALTASQKEAIRSIEELLRYLEDKYSRPFTFVEYRPASPGNPDTVSLLAREQDTAPGRRAVTVRRSGIGAQAVYSDDFPAVAAEPVYEALLKDYVKKETGADCKVYAFVSQTSLEQPPAAETDLDGKVCADSCIWLSERTVTEEQVKELASRIARHLQARGMTGRCQLMLLTATAWEKISRLRYMEYFNREDCLYREIVRVQG